MESIRTLLLVHSLVSLSLLITLATGFFVLPREFSVPSVKLLLRHIIVAASLFILASNIYGF
jgi:hypothetical protein